MKQETAIGKILLGILYASIAAAILGAVLFAVSSKNATGPWVVLGGERISVAIADTPKLQELGLSGHVKLAPNEGMLFIFPRAQNVPFWMKDMLFPLDIIWFDENHKLVDVWENANPSSYPEVRAPQKNAQYVLEVDAGFFQNHHLKIGDVLELELGPRYTN